MCVFVCVGGTPTDTHRYDAASKSLSVTEETFSVTAQSLTCSLGHRPVRGTEGAVMHRLLPVAALTGAKPFMAVKLVRVTSPGMRCTRGMMHSHTGLIHVQLKEL